MMIVMGPKHDAWVSALRREHGRELLLELSPGGSRERPIEVASAAVIEPRVANLACPHCGGTYRVHDGTRPQPSAVDPGTPSTQDTPGTPPSDAVVLFDGSDLSAWQLPNGNPAPWKVEEGALVIAPRTGSIQTKEEFGDCQLHLEFATPEPASGNGQAEGNGQSQDEWLQEVSFIVS